MSRKRLEYNELLQLKKFDTPTIFNGWSAMTDHDITKECLNLEETRDFMPEMGPMVGYAVTVVIEPSNPEHFENSYETWSKYAEFVASIPFPGIVIIQDLDKPNVIGSLWHEMNFELHKVFRCVGTITDGAIKDLDGMKKVGFKALARRLCVSNAYVTPIRWDCEVEVFGCSIKPGQLIHADKHGFLAIPEEDEINLLEAVEFMNEIRCNSDENLLKAVKDVKGKNNDEILAAIDKANAYTSKAIRDKYGR
ncbi:RraA family protein [Halanaerobiaceae bacterium Z-7014]|uniref:RraA family protein n=1 Tax=Halonatronomonas betaini TaxID=2778430 RepID=A0A931F9P9_9FIRM|nr:hypothetical protein [Halonatronomonas betaini]MBF8436137.1 RraA family protein [Halonatronomonas betaini]